jgi:3-hydroxyacyl-CoA dehydrogenase/enoyl-CoA hydratase/3-hydroxybutyryl-CoA epimerase
VVEPTFERLSNGQQLAWLSLPTDTQGRFGEPELGVFERMLDAVIARSDVAAVVLRGSDGGFCRGLTLPDEGRDRRAMQALSQRVIRLQSRLGDARIPCVAAIRGVCLDIGLELVLACSHRVVADHPDMRMGLPQIERGLLPVGDALVRLPAMMGLEASLDMLLDAETVGAAHADRVGLVHEVVHPAGLEAAARAAARTALEDGEPVGTKGWRPVLPGLALRNRRTLQRWKEARRQDVTLGGTRLSALEVLGRGRIDDTSELATAFSEAAVSEATATRTHVWRHARALQGWTPGPDVGVPEVQRLGIVGGGVVGADLAVAGARAGLTVRIREKSPPALGRALARIEGKVAADRDLERRTRARARISGGLELDGFSTMDLVLESVPEEVAVKRRVFAEIEDRVRADAIVATHPRATPVAEIGARMRHPERLVGIRVFRPLSRRPLCEIVQTPQTSTRALAAAVAFARRIDKTPVIVRDGPGFFTTRVLAAYLAHAGELVADGHTIEDIDRGCRRAGWPVGPLQLLDFVGLATAVRVGHVLTAALGERFEVPASLEAMAATGRGFYRAARSGPDAEADARVHDLLGVETTRTGDPDELGERLTLVAALEAVRCLQDGVLAQPSDGDVAAVLGLGYPATRGGPFRHLGARGLAAARGRLAALEDRFGARYQAPSLLVELAERGADFSSMEDTRA